MPGMIPDLDDWLRELTDGLPRESRRYEFRCHPDVFAAIREAADVAPQAAEAGATRYGSPAFGSADVLVQPELGSGCWELYEDGQPLKSGRLRRVDIRRHADHDPSLICRPAGYGLCELASPGAALVPWRELRPRRETDGTPKREFPPPGKISRTTP